MLYHLFLVLVLAVSGGAKSHGVQFRLAEGVVVCFVPESERQLIHPIMRIYPGGVFLNTAHSQPCLLLPIRRDVFVGIFAGKSSESPSEMDIVIANEDNMRILDIIKGMWVIKQYAQAQSAAGMLVPNAVIYLRSGKLDCLRNTLQPEQ
jgi:hypothetical protein